MGQRVGLGGMPKRVRKPRKQYRAPKSNVYKQLTAMFADEDLAREWMVARRWPEGPICPHCGAIDRAYKLAAKPDSKRPVRRGVWKCRDCSKQFTVTIGTVFAETHIPLNKWLHAMHLMCSSKKGISAHQLHRTLEVTYKTAWFLCNRIRRAMEKDAPADREQDPGRDRGGRRDVRWRQGDRHGGRPDGWRQQGRRVLAGPPRGRGALLEGGRPQGRHVARRHPQRGRGRSPHH
jgi:transposase-like protein